MLRNFNYTGRKKIDQADVPIVLVGEWPLRTFEPNLAALANYQLPLDARIYIEAYERTAYMRFPFGTVGTLNPPAEQSRVLTEFAGSDAIRFRVKIVEPEPGTQILAEADGILPMSAEESEENRIPLLPVRSAELGQEVWRLQFPDNPLDRPILLININAGDRIAVVRSTWFMTLAWPAILREIFSMILLVEEHTDLEDDSDWRTRWLEFGRSFLPAAQAPPEDPDACPDWMTQVIDAFCSKYTLLAKFKEQEEKE